MGAPETEQPQSGEKLADATLAELVEDLHARREQAKLGGGEEKIAVQHERGKL
ncbi:MAG: hypothetical protein QOG09_677, partial [Solirubrobacterales bacterium]|nr:hypothetical protein [Solirubrobacterales bacterium]